MSKKIGARKSGALFQVPPPLFIGDRSRNEERRGEARAAYFFFLAAAFFFGAAFFGADFDDFFAICFFGFAAVVCTDGMVDSVDTPVLSADCMDL